MINIDLVPVSKIIPQMLNINLKSSNFNSGITIVKNKRIIGDKTGQLTTCKTQNY
jgi:hypothetical protein